MPSLTTVIQSSYFNTTRLQQAHVVLLTEYEKAFPQKLFPYQTPDKIPSLTEMTVETREVLILILLVLPCRTKTEGKEKKGRGNTLSTTSQLPCLATFQKIPVLSLQKIRWLLSSQIQDDILNPHI